MTYRKITTGYVIQTFKNGKCIKQEFIAGESEYEDCDGNSIECQEGYYPFDMVQPEQDECLENW